MRTTIDIDEKLIKEVMDITHTRTKKEAINISLDEMVRTRRLKELADMVGNYEIDLTLSDLEEMRRDEHFLHLD